MSLSSLFYFNVTKCGGIWHGCNPNLWLCLLSNLKAYMFISIYQHVLYIQVNMFLYLHNNCSLFFTGNNLLSTFFKT